MGRNLAEKILSNHIVEGELRKESSIGIKIDQTLTQDSTGTMAYLQLELLQNLTMSWIPVSMNKLV